MLNYHKGLVIEANTDPSIAQVQATAKRGCENEISLGSSVYELDLNV
jgi:hypothetical protein